MKDAVIVKLDGATCRTAPASAIKYTNSIVSVNMDFHFFFLSIIC